MLMLMAMTHDELIDAFVAGGVLQTPALIDAFRATDRAKFVRPEYIDDAYIDEPLPIGFGATISQPYTVAYMLELLAPKPGERILDVGSGSGWTTGLLAHVVGEKGGVVGVEIVPELVLWSKANLREFEDRRIAILEALPGVYGVPQYAPYDRILVSAEAESVPDDLVKQLKEGGVMLIPVRGKLLRVIKGKDGALTEENHGDFAFVPLRAPTVSAG